MLGRWSGLYEPQSDTRSTRLRGIVSGPLPTETCRRLGLGMCMRHSRSYVMGFSPTQAAGSMHNQNVKTTGTRREQPDAGLLCCHVILSQHGAQVCHAHVMCMHPTSLNCFCPCAPVSSCQAMMPKAYVSAALPQPTSITSGALNPGVPVTCTGGQRHSNHGKRELREQSTQPAMLRLLQHQLLQMVSTATQRQTIAHNQSSACTAMLQHCLY
jgi:hypothetical protein